MARAPEVGKLLEKKDEKKLLKALEYKGKAKIRAEAADALGVIGESGAVKGLVSVMENKEEETAVRTAALLALGKVCTRLINSHNSLDRDALSRNDKKKVEKEETELEAGRGALKSLMESDSGELSLEAARTFMALPMTGSSVFAGELSESAFSFDAFQPPATETAEEPEPEPEEPEPEQEEPEAAEEEEPPAEEEPEPEQEEPETTEEEEPPAEEEPEPEQEQPKASEEQEPPAEEEPEPEQEEPKAAEEQEPPAEEEPEPEQEEPETTEEEEPPAEEEPEPEQEEPETTEEEEPPAEEPEGDDEPIFVNLEEPVEIAKDTYWLGNREAVSLERNIYLRIFRQGDRSLNLLIDPGPPDDLSNLIDKLAVLIGGVRNLHMIFLTHQDPDAAYNTSYIQKLNPACALLCSDRTWMHAWHYGLNERTHKSIESFHGMTAKLSTGHELHFIPSPFCSSRGATMLYDPETGVIFTGDLMGGISCCENLYADQTSCEGIERYHKTYMPTQKAVRYATERIRNLPGELSLIAPHHGWLIQGEFIQECLDRVEALEAGIDVFISQDPRQVCIKAMNEILDEMRDILTPQAMKKVMKNISKEETAAGVISAGKDGVESIGMDRKQAIEVFLKIARDPVPQKKLDLVDASIVKILSAWEIALPESFRENRDESAKLFE